MMTRRGFYVLILGFFLSIVASTVATAVPISGRILGSGGAPLAHARVELLPLATSFERQALELEGRGHAVPAVVAWSDVTGFFQLEAPRAGMWEVLVQAEGYLPVEFELFPLTTPLELPVVRLTHDAPVEVRVATHSGEPLAGARIRAEPRRDPARRDAETASWHSASRWAVTGPDGRAVLRRAASESLELTAAAADHVPAAKSWTSSEPVELRLAAGWQRLIELRQPGAEPVSRAVVSTMGRALGRTDRHGRLALTVPPGRDLEITFEAADGSGGGGLLKKEAPHVEGSVTAFTLTPRRFSGRVFSQSDECGAGGDCGLAGALVWPSERPEAWRRTGEQGRYTLSLPADPTSPRWVVAAAPEHLPAVERLPFEAGADLPSLVLTPAADLSGRVHDEGGRPVADAEVHVAPSETPPRASDTLALSDDQGRFHFRLLPPGQAYTLRVTASGFAPRAVDVSELEPFVKRSGVEVVLLRGRNAHGQVLDLDDQPVVGADVRLLRTVDDEDAATPRRLGADALQRTATDAEGRFDVHYLASGLYELWVEAPGFAPLTVGGLAVRSGDGSVDLGTVILAPGASVEGLVVDPQGHELSEVTVEILPTRQAVQRRAMAEDLSIPAVTTGADGWFRLSDLRPGETLTLRAWRSGYSPEVLAGVRTSRDEPLRIVLTPSARVAGQVLDEAGDSVERGRVRLVREGIDGELSGSAVLSEEGRFVADNVRPGRFKVMVLAPGYLGTERGGFEVGGGEEIDGVEIVLREGAVLEGRVFDPDGQVVTGARIRVAEGASEPGVMSFGDPAETTSGIKGRYRLAGLHGGRHTLVVEHAEHAAVTVDVDARGRRRLDLHLEQGWEVTGQVIDPERQAVTGARVQLVSSTGVHEALSGGEGGFRFAAVPDGSYRLQAEKTGYARVRWTNEFRVDAADVEDLEVALVRGGRIVGRVWGVALEELADLQVVARGATGDHHGQVRATGEYSVKNLAPGEWSVAAYLPGSNRQTRESVTLASDGDERAVDLELERGLALDGRLVRAGEPVDEATVALLGIDGRSTSVVRTGHEGRFRAEGLTEGRYNVTVVRRGHLLQRTTLDLDSDREIVLELPIHRVAGRVVAPDGTPLVGARVGLEALQEPGAGTAPPFSRTGHSGPEGLFQLEGIPEGVYRLMAVKTAFLPAEVSVQVSAGLDTDAWRIVLREAMDEAASP